MLISRIEHTPRQRYTGERKRLETSLGWLLRNCNLDPKHVCALSAKAKN